MNFTNIILKHLVLWVAFWTLFLPICSADSFPEIRIKGLIDVRLLYTDDTLSWLDDGLGKTRYGGDEKGKKQLQLGLASGSILIEPQFSWTLSALLHLQYLPEQRNNIGLVEGFLSYDPVSTSGFQYHCRLGVFFPSMSFENVGMAWKSPYTLTPSAINSWIGEELRTIGFETTALLRTEDNQLSLTGALFKANDAAGTLLAWRGWAMHDRTTTLSDRVPLAPIPSIQPGGFFHKQVPWVEPFQEIDNNIGYYGTFSWHYLYYAKILLTYYNNQGDLTAFDGEQYAWATRFFNISAYFEFPKHIELIGQYLIGESKMGLLLGQSPVDIGLWSYYILLCKSIERHRFTLRYDRFAVDDEDMTYHDNNNEKGEAWTMAYRFKIREKQHLMFEVLNLISNRPARLYLGFRPNQREVLLQLGYRFFF